MPLRYYQEEAVEAVFDYWNEHDGHPLLDMATGVGKSMTLADLLKRLITGWPDMRLMCTTHVQELVEGNYLELMKHYPHAPAGIYASSLGRRDRRAQILFSQLQTVYNKAKEIGGVDVLGIDEVHMVPPNAETMYGQLINDLFELNPDMKIVGLTATIYRLDSGRLDEGDDRLFDEVVYQYGIRQGIDDGYLTPITSRPTSTRQDTSCVRKSGYDLSKTQLQKAVDVDDLNRRIVEEVLDEEGKRNKALFFCAGIEHALHMRDILREFGVSCETVSGNTPKTERRRIIEAYKAGEFWAMTNDNILSVGTNIPAVDLIADCAKTLSASRYVQRVGRMTRVVYPRGFNPDATDAEGRRAAIASGVKPDARYMDFAGNLNYHGPVDMIEPKKPGKGNGEAPIKICPQDEGGCGEQLHASLRVCWKCGHEFEFEEHKNLSERASDAPILSSTAPEPRQVTRRTFRFHEGKPGKKDSVKVTYMIGLTPIPEWVCPAHEGYAKTRADQYWKKHGGEEPCPETPLEWLERQAELKDTIEIKVRPKGRYWDVCGHTVSLDLPDAKPVNWSQELEDEIPF